MKLRFVRVFLKWFLIYGTLFGAFGISVYFMLFNSDVEDQPTSNIVKVIIVFLIPVVLMSLNNAGADCIRKKNKMKEWLDG